MHCLIVDDDEMIRTDLEQRIRRMPGLRLIASCGDATSAAEVMMKNVIHLILLDVQLPGMSGIQFLKMLDRKKPAVVLITSRKEYAAEAFDYDVTDFLVKPFSEERFLKAVMRASKYVQSNPGTAQADHIFVRVNSVLEKISLSEILYVEALADYVQIMSAKQRYVVHATMKSMESALPSSLFFRAHNSFIVRLDRISRIEDNTILIGDKVIPVSRAKIKPLLERLNLLRD
ncbi:MAG TPA: LytTR family DNA-binding domain-containing protein [Bacteroidia bacterium]|nr:LytTR family DNA-binding domain-containing protein [Bacteroidia bacterium]